MARNQDYWKRRFEAMEDSQYQKSQEYYETVKEQFRQAQNDIQMDMEHWYGRLAKNNDISLAGAKKLLKQDELKEFQWNVNQYIKAGEENAMDQHWMKELENASAKYHINSLQAMKLQMQQHVEKLFTEYEGGTTEFLNKTFGDQYKHAAYEIAKGTGVGSNLTQLDTRKIDTLVKKPWAADGANYSDRIWANKQKLTNTLNTELTQSIIRGDDPAKAIRNLSQTMEVSQSQAGRLIMTESAAVSAAAQKECFQELDVERYEIVATLDSHTSEICRGMDGKVFRMSEYEVGVTAPPFHPWCRTTTVPYFEDNETTRAARGEDGATSYVDGKMTYQEWEASYGKPEPEYMSDSFRPKYGKQNTISLGKAEIPVKKVENSAFDMWTDVDASDRDMAVKLCEKHLEEVRKEMPQGFDMPRISVVDFEKHSLNPNAIAGYDQESKTFYWNAKYKTENAVKEYLKKQEGFFASTDINSPFLHELGHKYHYDLIDSIAKSKGISYNQAKDLLEEPIAEYINQNSLFNNDIIHKELSTYAEVNYRGDKRFNELMAEYFTVRAQESPSGLVKLINEIIKQEV